VFANNLALMEPSEMSYAIQILINVWFPTCSFLKVIVKHMIYSTTKLKKKIELH